MNLPSESDSFKDIFEAIHDGLTVLNVDDPDFASHVETARNLIEVFRTDGPNTYKCGGFEIELDKIATAMLDCSFDPRGNPYVVSAILKCGFVDKTSETERSAMFTLTFAWLTRFLFILKIGHFMKASAAPSDIDSPAIEGASPGVAELGDRYSDLREKVLQRDGYKCVITGRVDKSGPEERRPAVSLDVVHILQRNAVGFPNDRSTPKLKAAAETLDILMNWICIGKDVLKETKERIDDVSNMIMLEKNVHDLFDNYRFCLRHMEGNTYKLECLGDDFRAFEITHQRNLGNRLPLDALITFGDSSDVEGGLPVPKPIFLGIHAAIADVLHMSGVGEFIDQLLLKYGLLELENIGIRCWEDLELCVSISQLIVAAKV